MRKGTTGNSTTPPLVRLVLEPWEQLVVCRETAKLPQVLNEATN
jgi:hypothetical protein